VTYQRRYVPVPDGHNTPLTKEEFLSHVASLGTDLSLARYRYEHTICEGLEPRNCLDEEEERLWQLAHESAKKLCDRHDMSAVEKLAEVAKKTEAEAKADAEREVVFSLAVDKIIEGYSSPVGKFAREQPAHEVVRLAMALLEYAGCEEQVLPILKLLHKAREESHHYASPHDAPVWACPRCEGEGHMGGRPYAKDVCKLCGGWGYVLANADTDYDSSHDGDEIDLTYEGRQAINRGETWTPEDEAIASGYDSIEEAKEDGWREPDWFKTPEAEEKAA